MNCNADTLLRCRTFRRRAYRLRSAFALFRARRIGTRQTETSTSPDQQLWQTVKKANVVYVGETHDDSADHQYELELIRGLLNRKRNSQSVGKCSIRPNKSTMDLWTSHIISFKEMTRKDWISRDIGEFIRQFIKKFCRWRRARTSHPAVERPARTCAKNCSWRTINGGAKGDDSDRIPRTEGGYRNLLR